MKRVIYLLCIAAFFTACKKNKTPEAQPVDLPVKVSYRLNADVMPLSDVELTIKNLTTNTTQTAKTDSKGQYNFSSLATGTYDIVAKVTFSATKYTELTGVYSNAPVTYNASIRNKIITPDFNEQIELTLVAGTTSDWVIKQIYYAGSNVTDGALYRDQFIEIHNNSDQVLYADSLYFAELTGRMSFTNTTYHILGDGQLDWQKSQDMPASIDANNDYIYSRALSMIPGTGKQYPVEPGKSIIIAQTALNHKEPFTGSDGKSISVRNPALTIDLSKAQFEAYYAGNGANPLDSDIDNPNSVNVEVLQMFGRDMIFDTNGRTAYAIFKINDGPRNLKEYHYPTISAPSSGATKYIQIPNKYVLDAVEAQPVATSSRVPKKLNASFDSGFASVPGGIYSSQSVIRKTEKTVNGRVVLQDTNNSSEDFVYLTLANPFGFAN